jgi:hypothetical protein
MVQYTLLIIQYSFNFIVHRKNWLKDTAQFKVVLKMALK